MSIYYHCFACDAEWMGDLECPRCGNRELKGPSRIDGGGRARCLRRCVQVRRRARGHR